MAIGHQLAFHRPLAPTSGQQAMRDHNPDALAHQLQYGCAAALAVGQAESRGCQTEEDGRLHQTVLRADQAAGTSMTRRRESVAGRAGQAVAYAGQM
jgi:hypothetical protein